jgi:hypothetical protein
MSLVLALLMAIAVIGAIGSGSPAKAAGEEL